MTPIRPLEREDLSAVARLYELVIRSETPNPPAGLERYFERTVLDQPFADPEIPALVYDDPRRGIVGFIASYPRPYTIDGRSIRMACSGQQIAHPDVRSKGVGALLMRAYMAGPQDLSISDGATGEVREMWERLGGVTNSIASVAWTRVFGPTGYAAGSLAKRRAPDGRPAAVAPGGRLWAALDGLAGRPLRPSAPAAGSEPLTPAALLELLETLGRTFRVRPAYDAAALQWLFGEMGRVTPRGPLVRRLVRGADGRALGWYVVYVPPGGTAQVMQAVAGRQHTGVVLDELFHHVAGLGAAAVSGRVDAWLYPHLVERNCVFRRAGWALLRSSDPELLNACAFGHALMTRMDGEWWMGPHVLDADALAQIAAS